MPDIGLDTWLGIGGVAIAVLFGWMSLRDGQKLRKATTEIDSKNKEQLQLLGRVSDGVLTQTVGQFPEFVTHIGELVGKATRSLTIFCDHPAYGIFSGEEDFDRYLAALRKAVAEPTIGVRLLFLSPDARTRLHTNQFEPRWKDLIQDETFRRRLDAFIERSRSLCEGGEGDLPGEGTKAAEYSPELFVERLEAVHRRVFDDLLQGCRRSAIDLDASVYFWIRDQEEAILVIAPLGLRAREVGFHTVDPHLIRALEGISERYWSLAAADGPTVRG